MRKNIYPQYVKKSPEARVYLAPCIMPLLFFAVNKVRCKRCEESSHEVDMSLFSIHAYLYGLQFYTSLYFQAICFWIKPRKRSACWWEGSLDWLAPGRLCANALFHYSPTLSKAPLHQVHLFLLFSAAPRVHIQTQTELPPHTLKTHVLTGMTLPCPFCARSDRRQTPAQRERPVMRGEMGGSRATKEG